MDLKLIYLNPSWKNNKVSHVRTSWNHALSRNLRDN